MIYSVSLEEKVIWLLYGKQMLGGCCDKSKSEENCGKSTPVVQRRVGWTMMVAVQMGKVDGFEIHVGKEMTEYLNG